MSVHTTNGRAGWNATLGLNGAYTFAALWKSDYFAGSVQLFTSYKTDGFACRSGYLESNNLWSEGVNAPITTGDLGNPPFWAWVVHTISSGTDTPRMHFGVYAESGALTWTHMDASGALPARSADVSVYIGDPFGSQFRGNLACMSFLPRDLTDAEVEAIFVRSSALIMAESPSFFAHWPEAGGVDWTDLAGGASEIAPTGTWDATTDPPSFDFALTPARTGRPKIWNGSAWIEHPLKVWNGSAWVEHPVKGHDGTDWVLSK